MTQLAMKLFAIGLLALLIALSVIQLRSPLRKQQHPVLTSLRGLRLHIPV